MSFASIALMPIYALNRYECKRGLAEKSFTLRDNSALQTYCVHSVCKNNRDIQNAILNYTKAHNLVLPDILT